MRISNLFTALSGLSLDISATADHVLSENTISNDNPCVGDNCYQIETYSGYATLRLKSARNRIEADDTSSSTLPSNAWAILFNDGAVGGAG